MNFVANSLDSSTMDTADTDARVQYCLNRLARTTDDADAQQVVRELLSVAAGRILMLCGTALRRHYPRLAKGPFNVQPEDLIGAVVERLIKAMRTVLPTHVREFFALTMKHIRWELNEVAREPHVERNVRLPYDVIARESETGDEHFSPLGHQILKAIRSLAQSDQEIFNLVRLHSMTQRDAAEVLGISERTVERRLKRIMPRLWGELGGIQRPQGPEPRRNRILPPSFVAAQAETGEQFATVAA
jgi:RNA polymerase sigma-70 factor (ECF subfamily)